MKIGLALFSTFLLAKFAIADMPQIVQAKEQHIHLYTDSKETELLGYKNFNQRTDGEYVMIKSFVQNGDTVFDVGANIGKWSELVLEHTKRQCRLYAFEPVPQLFNQLTQKFGNTVKCFNIALGKVDAKVLINQYQGKYAGCSSLFERKVMIDRRIPTQKVEVLATSLDRFCKNNRISHIDFLKIDVEGSEWNILQGATELMSNKKIKIVQFEYGGTYVDAHATLQQTYAYLASKGYAIFRITANGLVYIPRWRDKLENFTLSNYLAVLK